MKSYYQDDLVVCVHGGGFSRAEQTLLEGGHDSAVIQQRIEIQQRMRDRLEAVIERATRRRVIAFMSGNQDDPEMMCELFILAPTDLLDDQPTPSQNAPHRRLTRRRSPVGDTLYVDHLTREIVEQCLLSATRTTRRHNRQR
jgi:uncharacterized protein YbcI